MAEGSRGSRVWLLVPVVVVELLLLVAVVGGVRAVHDRQTLQSSHALRATAAVTRTSESCRGGCVWDSYGSYTVAGHRESDVLLRCCADAPLSGSVPVRLAAGDLRHPVVVGVDERGPVVLGAAAAVVLVLGNAALVVVLLRRRRRVV